MSATLSPLPTPSLRSPAASASARSRIWPQVKVSEPPLVRTAMRSGTLATVCSSACVMVSPATGGAVRCCAAVVASMPWNLPQVEALAARQPADVVGQPDEGDEDDDHEADDARSLHHGEGNGATADLLGHGPEHVSAVQRKEREEVDDRQGQRDQGEDEQRLGGVERERFARRLI